MDFVWWRTEAWRAKRGSILNQTGQNGREPIQNKKVKIRSESEKNETSADETTYCFKSILQRVKGQLSFFDKFFAFKSYSTCSWHFKAMLEKEHMNKKRNDSQQNPIHKIRGFIPFNSIQFSSLWVFLEFVWYLPNTGYMSYVYLFFLIDSSKATSLLLLLLEGCCLLDFLNKVRQLSLLEAQHDEVCLN